MFASIRKYKLKRGSTEEFARRMKDGFVALIREIPGFQGYYLLDGGSDVLIAISMFDSADEAPSRVGIVPLAVEKGAGRCQVGRLSG